MYEVQFSRMGVSNSVVQTISSIQLTSETKFNFLNTFVTRAFVLLHFNLHFQLLCSVDGACVYERLIDSVTKLIENGWFKKTLPFSLYKNFLQLSANIWSTRNIQYHQIIHCCCTCTIRKKSVSFLESWHWSRFCVLYSTIKHNHANRC